MPGDVLSGLHSDVSQAGLGDDVGVQTADGHQAAQVAAFVVGLVVLVEAHFGRRPTLQVTGAVDGAEALAVSCAGREKGEVGVKYRRDLRSKAPSKRCGDDGKFLQANELEKNWAEIIYDLLILTEGKSTRPMPPPPPHQ